VSRAAAVAAAALAAVLVAAGLAPDSALAHGIVGREDLPVPKVVFLYAATVVLVVSFVALAFLWPRPRLEAPEDRDLLRVPRVVEALCGLSAWRSSSSSCGPASRACRPRRPTSRRSSSTSCSGSASRS
jgi:hypothetical protein